MATNSNRSNSGRRRRVPPPPVIREKPVVERVLEGPGAGAKVKRKRKRGGSEVDVSGVAFVDVAPDTASKLRRRLVEAANAFEAERFGDAQSLLESIDSLAPGVPEVQELLGLSLYRQGRWAKAIKHLQAFADATGSVEQHPVMADCHRGLKHWDQVAALWKELGAASPTPELVEEGRIVYAGALADQGRAREAIRTLEQAPKAPKKPKLHHFRRWYALADLYERNGDTGRARRLFAEIEQLSSGFGDARERARQLR